MAVIRFRPKRILILLLILSFIVLLYLLSSLPGKDLPVSFSKQNAENGHLQPGANKPVSETRKLVTTYFPEKLPIQPELNVLVAPQLPRHDLDSKLKPLNASDSDSGEKTDVRDKNTNHAGAKDGDSLVSNRTYTVGVSVQNRTLSVGEKMKLVKNKTLELVALSGVAKSKRREVVYVKHSWNLSVSFEDIGNIMKDTQYLNKVDPLNLDGPVLSSSRNRTANFTYTMPLKLGYCDCFERYCVCCSRLSNKRLHLNSTACSNFTFISKTHELDLKFSMDEKPIHKALISADKSPLLCLGSQPAVVDICVHFYNMTFRVNEHNDAQTQLLGCTNLILNLYNISIGAFPTDCFQIPGDPNQVHRKRNFNMVFNWVP